MKKDTLLKILLVLSFVGILTSTYLLYDHYNPGIDVGVCDITAHGESSCAIVNQSEYSEIFGFPAALLGIIWFVVLAYLSWKAFRMDSVKRELLIWTSLGMLFVAYFIYGEFMLRTICSFCTFIHVLTLISFVISLYLYKSK